MTPLELILSKIPDFGKCRACGTAHPLASAAAAAKGIWGNAAAAASSFKNPRRNLDGVKNRKIF